MRRAILAVIAGSTLLAGSACDSDAKTTEATATSEVPPASTAPSTAPPDYSASTELVCGRLNSLYTTELRAFGAAVGKMITYQEAKQTADAAKAEKAAAAQLQAAARKIRKETAAADDPDFQAAGKVSAAKLESSAKDRKYLHRQHSMDDFNKTAQAQLAEWLSPVAGYCVP